MGYLCTRVNKYDLGSVGDSYGIWEEPCLLY